MEEAHTLVHFLPPDSSTRISGARNLLCAVLETWHFPRLEKQSPHPDDKELGRSQLASSSQQISDVPQRRNIFFRHRNISRYITMVVARWICLLSYSVLMAAAKVQRDVPASTRPHVGPFDHIQIPKPTTGPVYRHPHGLMKRALGDEICGYAGGISGRSLVIAGWICY